MVLVLVLTGVGAAQVRNKVNAIQRVVNLRQAKKIAAEMQQEAALHPHFKCYCRSTGQELKINAEDGSARIAFGGVELKTLNNVLKESREEAKEALAIEGGPVGKVAFDAESSDLAANIVALTRAIAALEKGVVGSSFLSDLHGLRHPQCGHEFQVGSGSRPFHVVVPLERRSQAVLTAKRRHHRNLDAPEGRVVG